MIKCIVTEDFTLKDFAKLKNITRKARNVEGKLFIGDSFECDETMADYLTGNNPLNKKVVEVVEVKIKEAKIVEKVEDAIEGLDKKTSKKKRSKKEVQ